jgi:hypothetical protein
MGKQGEAEEGGEKKSFHGRFGAGVGSTEAPLSENRAATRQLGFGCFMLPGPRVVFGRRPGQVLV